MPSQIARITLRLFVGGMALTLVSPASTLVIDWPVIRRSLRRTVVINGDRARA